MARPTNAIRTIKHHKGITWEVPRKDGDPVGHRRYQLDVGISSHHVPLSVRGWQSGKDPNWQDADVNWKETSDDYREGNAYYRIRVPKNKIGYRYESRTEGFPFVDIELTHIGSTKINNPPTPELRGRELWWVDVTPGVDIYLQATVDKVEIRKRIRTASADRSFTFNIKETNPLPIRRQKIPMGHDNADLAEPSRIGTRPGRIRRQIEIITTITPLSSPEGESWCTHKEEWTGKTYALDANRVKSLSTDFVLPIDIDVLVEETIASDNDDGYGYEPYDGSPYLPAWYTSYAGSQNGIVYDSPAGFDNMPGWRFTSVAIPNGANIIDATFEVEIAPPSGSVAIAESSLHGAAEDDAAAFEDSTRPSQRTPIGSGSLVTWTATPAGSDVSLDVTTTIGEITSRAGWSSGNALVLFDPTAHPADNYAYAYFEDAADSDPGAGRLTVNYTTLLLPDLPGRSGFSQALTIGTIRADFIFDTDDLAQIHADSTVDGVMQPAKQLFISRSGLVIWEQWDRKDRGTSAGSGLDDLENGWGMRDSSPNEHRGQIIDRELLSGGTAIGGFGLDMSNNIIVREWQHKSKPFSVQPVVPVEAIAQINCEFPVLGFATAGSIGIWLRHSEPFGGGNLSHNGIFAAVKKDGSDDITWESTGRDISVTDWDVDSAIDGAAATGTPLAVRVVVAKSDTAPGKVTGRTYGATNLSSLQDLSKDVTFKAVSGTFVDDGGPPALSNVRVLMPSKSLADDFFVCGRWLMFSEIPQSHSVEVEGRQEIFETGSRMTGAGPINGNVSFSVDTWALPIIPSMSLLSASVEIATIQGEEGCEIFGGTTIEFGFGPTDVFTVDGATQAKTHASSLLIGSGTRRRGLRPNASGFSQAELTGSHKTATFKEAFVQGSGYADALAKRIRFIVGTTEGSAFAAATGSSKTATFKEAFIEGLAQAEGFGTKKVVFNIAEVQGSSWVSRGVFRQIAQFTGQQIHGVAQATGTPRMSLKLGREGADAFGQALDNARLGIRVPFGQKFPEIHGQSLVENTALSKTAVFREAFADGDSSFFGSVNVTLRLGIGEVHGDSSFINAIRMFIDREPQQTSGFSFGRSEFELGKLGFRYVIVQPAGGFTAPVCVFLDSDAPLCIILPNNETIPITLEELERVGITLEDIERVCVQLEDETQIIQLPNDPLGDD